MEVFTWPILDGYTNSVMAQSLMKQDTALTHDFLLSRMGKSIFGSVQLIPLQKIFVTEHKLPDFE